MVVKDENQAGGEKKPAVTTRSDILIQIDELIERVNRVRKIFLGMTFSTIILAPLSILLSGYLVLHPSFYKILVAEDRFGYVLAVLLGFVISISCVWLVTGLRQHRVLKLWNSRYADYIAEKDRVEKVIAAQYGLEEDGQPHPA
jgi:hypothetical protein